MRTSSGKIKKEQKKSLLFREIAQLLSQLTAEEKSLSSVYVTRLDFSPGSGACYIYFYSADGEEKFKEALQTLKLYKPSLRTAIAKTMQSKYTPEIIFKYDNELEKELRMEKLLEEIKSEEEKED